MYKLYHTLHRFGKYALIASSQQSFLPSKLHKPTWVVSTGIVQSLYRLYIGGNLTVRHALSLKTLMPTTIAKNCSLI